jgi:hypothetical protein
MHPALWRTQLPLPAGAGDPAATTLLGLSISCMRAQVAVAAAAHHICERQLVPLHCKVLATAER